MLQSMVYSMGVLQHNLQRNFRLWNFRVFEQVSHNFHFTEWGILTGVILKFFILTSDTGILLIWEHFDVTISHLNETK